MNKARFAKNLFLLSIAVILLGSILFLGLFAWLSRDLPDPNSLTEREVAQSTKIYDRSGEHLLYEIAGDEKRTLVTLEELPSYVPYATITAEDRHFYTHSGIDIKGILRAMFVNITTFDPTGQGGSTITQQLVKNAILTNEQTYTRKLKEVILSLALERRYTKDEILQLYLNEIPYGSTNYGIESAALAYFQKQAKDLSLGEAATLAALPKAPTTLLNNPDELKARRDWIVSSMAELGYVSQEEADAAIASDTAVDISISNIEAPHFVLWVKEQLEELYTERTVEQGGLIVKTSLDFEMQQAAEEAVEANREKRSAEYGFNNSGLVALDPNTGEVLAMVGSADYFDDDIDGQVNVTMRPLQPGSSFKPIIYTAAFELGYTPNSILWDTLTTFATDTDPYEPHNYDLEEHGPVTLRSALQGSLNIPAVKLLSLISTDAGADFAERLRYTTLEDRSRFGLSMVLGGAEVELLEHVGAYGVFATGGMYFEPVSILEVKDPDGEELLVWKAEENEGEEVLDSNVAAMISDVLSDNVARTPYFGENNYLTLSGRAAAAKTGTTNDYKDAWTVGYTPQIVAGVWTGNTDGSQMRGGAGGSAVAAPIWNAFMESAHAGKGVESFVEPEIPVTGNAILDGEIPSELVVIDSASGQLATDLTPDRFKETVVCGEYHTILHFVDRNDPLAGIPENPQSDPDYESWEAGVQSYLETYNANLTEGEAPLENCEVPTDEDDVHVKANAPKVDIDSPSKNSSVDRTFSVSVDASSRRGIDRMEYFIDGTLIAVSSRTTGAKLTLPSWVDGGSHTLTVTAYDDVDNAGSDSVRITVKNDAVSERISITNPFDNQIIERSSDAYNIVLEMSNSSRLRDLKVEISERWTGIAIEVIDAGDASAVTIVPWALPEAGDYLISATAESSDGDNVQATPVQVKIQETVDTSQFSLIEDVE